MELQGHFLVCAFLATSVYGDGLLGPYPPAVPATSYGVPVAPYPAAIEKLEVPAPIVKTDYSYKLHTPLKIEVPLAPYPAKIETPVVVEKLAPYPAPVLEYGVPNIEVLPPPKPIATTYSYNVHTPLKLAPYPAAVEVVKTAPYPPAVPAVEYGVPRVAVLPPPTPIATSYSYNVHTPLKIVQVAKVGPYPPAVPVPEYGVPNVEVPLAPYPAKILPAIPAVEYGIPRIAVLPPPKPVLTSYSYNVHTPVKVEVPLGPYPAAVEIAKVGPYAPAIPAVEYGVPKVEVLPPPIPVATSYSYKVHTPLKIAPVLPTPLYGPLVEVVKKIELPPTPHLTYGL